MVTIKITSFPVFETVISVQVDRITMQSHFQLPCFPLRIALVRIITGIKKYGFAMEEKDAVHLQRSFCRTSMHGDVMHAISSSTQHLAKVQLQTFYVIIFYL